VKAEDIPQELIDILDDRAGQKHSRTGSVITCLAEILTRYDTIKAAGPNDGMHRISRQQQRDLDPLISQAMLAGGTDVGDVVVKAYLLGRRHVIENI
jgi:hypothetical protein